MTGQPAVGRRKLSIGGSAYPSLAMFSSHAAHEAATEAWGQYASMQPTTEAMSDAEERRPP